MFEEGTFPPDKSYREIDDEENRHRYKVIVKRCFARVGSHFGGNRPDRYSHDVIDEFELRDLLFAEYFRYDKQVYYRSERKY